MSQTSSTVIFNKKSIFLWMPKMLLITMVFISINYGKLTAQGRKKELSSSRAVTKKICFQLEQTIRARHKSCFLRPDTGPCRADIVQWYYDVKQRLCYRFYWGGCQGNGNRFETEKECIDHCYLGQNETKSPAPQFCSMAFDYGTCFGHYYRWSWDTIAKACKRRLYSGCGGNQNNFHSLEDCRAACLLTRRANNLKETHQMTTCVPFHVGEMQK